MIREKRRPSCSRVMSQLIRAVHCSSRLSAYLLAGWLAACYLIMFHHRTERSGVRLDNQLVSPPVKFPTFYGTSSFIVVTTCPCPASDQFSPCPPYSLKTHFNIILHPCYNWINQLSNTTSWWLGICCLFHRYQLHVSALMAIFRLTD